MIDFPKEIYCLGKFPLISKKRTQYSSLGKLSGFTKSQSGPANHTKLKVSSSCLIMYDPIKCPETQVPSCGCRYRSVTPCSGRCNKCSSCSKCSKCSSCGISVVAIVSVVSVVSVVSKQVTNRFICMSVTFDSVAKYASTMLS